MTRGGTSGRGRGEHHPHAKLTESDVRRMRQLRADGWGISRLAREFTVCEQTVIRVCNRHAWRHVVD